MFFFLPTGTAAAQSRKPVVTLALMGACTAVFLVTEVFTSGPPPEFSLQEAEAYAREHPYLVDDDYDGPVPNLLQVQEERRTLDTLVASGLERAGGLERRLSLVPRRGAAQIGWLTNLFIHFDLFHLLGNMLFLWLVGPLLEEAWGRRRFLAFYLAAGFVASAVQYAMSHASPASIGGASGAIAGCMGAFALRFALVRIRIHYFLWLFIRVFVGSVHVPAWLCGVAWFGREFLNLRGGGETGVATGAHVGGFVLGALVALAMKATGSERELLTVAETEEQRADRQARFEDAQASVRVSDWDQARATLRQLQEEVPDYPGAAWLMAEVDVRSQRGLMRLEKVVRPLLTRPDQRAEVRQRLRQLWPFIDAKGFSSAFAWQLSDALRSPRQTDDDMIEALLQAVAASGGALAPKAQAKLGELTPRPAPEEAFAGEEPASLATVAPPPALEPPRVLLVTLVGARAEGLDVVVNGGQRLVPYRAIEGVHGGIISISGRRALWVDLVIRQGGPRTALRLSGADPVVPTLFPGKPVPEAWMSLIAGIRRAAGVQPGSPPWSEVPTEEALTRSWAPA
jgi:membrane associated rhomboid family serine protease